MSVDTKKIFELKQQIQELLKERPNLIPLQRRIDALMSGAGNQHNRCVLLGNLMQESMNELGAKLKEFNTEADRYISLMQSRSEKK